MKIAVLILAHKNPHQLEQLVNILKPDFELFIHLDKRSPVPETLVNIPHVHIAEKRYTTYWGSYHTQLAMLELYKMAYKNNCDYYFLISGQDLPLMANKDITAFIRNNYRDHIYAFPLPRKDWNQNHGLNRMQLYWDIKYDSGNPRLKPLLLPLKGAAFMLRLIQKTFGLRRKINFPLYCGSLWMNLTREAVGYILSFIEKNDQYIDRYKYTRCTDEIFFHTILFGFDYPGKDTIVNKDLRYIDWQTGPDYPRIFTSADYERCIHSNLLFGRKFDENVDREVIDRIIAHITT